MQTVTFNLLASLAYYVASKVYNDSSILVAIAKATMNKQLDDTVSVTVTEDEIVFIYQQLTALAEGIAAKPNDQLEDILTPILMSGNYNALAGRIQQIKDGNEQQRNDSITEGLAKVSEIQAALANN